MMRLLFKRNKTRLFYLFSSQERLHRKNPRPEVREFLFSGTNELYDLDHSASSGSGFFTCKIKHQTKLSLKSLPALLFYDFLLVFKSHVWFILVSPIYSVPVMQRHWEELNVDFFHNVKITWWFFQFKYPNLQIFSQLACFIYFLNELHLVKPNSIHLPYQFYSIRLVPVRAPGCYLHGTWRGLFNQVLQLSCA